MTLIHIIAIIFGSIAALSLFAYLPRLVAWFGSLRPQKKLSSDIQHKLALIIPARNESKTICTLFDSIIQQSYPRDRYDVFVVVKEADDPTIALTQAIGGKAVVCPTQKCKGDALDACFQTILSDYPDEYDAHIIIDADCVLHKDFLTEMNNAIASGATIIQGKRLVKNRLMNKNNSLVSDCNGQIWTIIDQLGNRYKADKGITGMTIGTGVMLRNAFIKEQGGWKYRQTLTEDIELMYDCAAKDMKTYYTEYALIYVEESPLLGVTNNRRTRWMTGVVDSRRIYAKRISELPRTKKNIRNAYFTNALELVYIFIGSLQLHGMIQGLVAIGMLLFGEPAFTAALLYSLSSYALIYLSFFALTLACLISDRKYSNIPFGRKLAVLFVHPIFYMGYITIVRRALARKNPEEWIYIERSDFVNSENEQ